MVKLWKKCENENEWKWKWMKMWLMKWLIFYYQTNVYELYRNVTTNVAQIPPLGLILLVWMIKFLTLMWWNLYIIWIQLVNEIVDNCNGNNQGNHHIWNSIYSFLSTTLLKYSFYLKIITCKAHWNRLSICFLLLTFHYHSRIDEFQIIISILITFPDL